tara:strand:- start:1303 stop:2478 length:1176 start_codon:yes stop_codon:yes gene_type:complete
MRLFDERYMKTSYPFGSGVWGKKEWVHPDIEIDNIVSLYEGGTNLFWAERFGRELGMSDLWIKQCGNSHTGSFKDLGMTVLISNVKQMISTGVEIKAVICASTGDTSASLAAYCAAAGIPTVVLLPKGKISISQLIQPLSNGAITLAVDTDFDGCMNLARMLSDDKTFYLANSINPLRIEGQKTISVEIVQQDDWNVPDWIIVPSGNLGNITAVGMGFKMMYDLGLISSLPRLVAAQSANSAPLFKSYETNYQTFEAIKSKPTLASAIQIGNPVSAPRAIPILKEFDSVVTAITESELSDAAAKADRTGLYCCPQTGVAIASLMKLLDSRIIQKNEKVIVLSTANGLKFTDFKSRYHERTIEGIDIQLDNSPIEISSDYKTLLNTVNNNIG